MLLFKSSCHLKVVTIICKSVLTIHIDVSTICIWYDCQFVMYMFRCLPSGMIVDCGQFRWSILSYDNLMTGLVAVFRYIDFMFRISFHWCWWLACVYLTLTEGLRFEGWINHSNRFEIKDARQIRLANCIWLYLSTLFPSHNYSTWSFDISNQNEVWCVMVGSCDIRLMYYYHYCYMTIMDS